MISCPFLALKILSDASSLLTGSSAHTLSINERLYIKIQIGGKKLNMDA